jgi:hypothetical protein
MSELNRGTSNEGPGHFGPLLQLGQPVRRHEGSEIGVVLGIIFGTVERALVRWVDGSRLEPVENLIEVNRLSPSAMSEQPDAGCLIRAKLAIGQLPRRTNTKSWAGLGTGLLCDGCDQPIAVTDIEYQVDAIGLGTLRFHKACMRFWQEASAIRHDLAGGSEPFPLVFPHSWRAPHRMAPTAIRNGHAATVLSTNAQQLRMAVVVGLSRATRDFAKDGLRLHRAGRLMAVRGRRQARAAYTVIVAVAVVVAIGVGLATRPISNAPVHEVARHHIASPQLESPALSAASPPLRQPSTSRQSPPRRVVSSTARRHSNVVRAASSGSSVSVTSVSRLPLAASPTEPLALMTEQRLLQAP